MWVQTCPRKDWIFLVVFSVPLLPVSYSSVEQNRGAKAMESCKFIDLLKNRLKTTIRLCCTLPYSSLHCSNLLYATLLYFTLCYATLLDSSLHYATPLYFYSSLPYSTVLYSTLVYSMLCCTTLRYSMPLYPTLLYSTPLYIAISFSSNKHVQSYWFFFYLTVLTAKLPPRVDQTAHWMSCTDMFKKFGYRKSFVIFLLQALFGTIDEVIFNYHVTK